MEAGIEHLGRGTAIGVDHMIIVVEPSGTSIETAFRIKKLADDLHIRSIQIIGNKIQGPEDEKFLKGELGSFNILGFIQQSEDIRRVSLRKVSPFDIGKASMKPVEAIIDSLVHIPVEG
jgi:CO dehydrogenase maturation factor